MAEPSAAFLEVGNTADGGSRVPLAGNRVVIGRQAGVGVRINDLKVSRQHAELFRDPFQRWWVRDLGSRNGTKVNGSKIRKEHALKPGDVIGIESICIGFHLTTSSTRSRPSTGHSMTVMEDSEQSQVRSLRDIKPPKIDTAHLSRLTDFGNQLMNNADPEQRMRMLCAMLVTEDFRGRSAAVLRVVKDTEISGDTGTEQLCEPQFAENSKNRHAPYVSGTTLRTVQQTGTSVVASNVMDGTGVLALSMAGDQLPRMSIVACPLGSDDQFLDVLYVVLPVEYGTGEWLALVQLASEEYRQAEMTWAAREQAESNAAIEHELEKGRQIQLRLVAKDVNIDGIDVGIGFQPCQWVGGDYVDAVATGDGRVFLTVADVCGKGLQAALITSSLHTMVHTNVMSGFELADMIRRLNHYLCQTLPDDSFVSMIAIVLDLATGEFQCVNAGHPPAILIGESAEPKHLQSGVNPPLGLDQVDYGIDNGKLDHDRVLAMYTDGLTEMRDAESGEMLGIEGVESCIRNLWSSNQSQPAQTIAESLTRFLDERRGRHFAADDQTFLLARLL